jgi:hypothetical protein
MLECLDRNICDDYSDVIPRCPSLNSFPRRLSLDNAEVQQELHQKVVQPIERFVVLAFKVDVNKSSF